MQFTDPFLGRLEGRSIQGSDYESGQHRTVLQGPSILLGLQTTSTERPSCCVDSSNGPYSSCQFLLEDKAAASCEAILAIRASAQ